MKNHAFRGGSYSLAITAIVLAILIVINMLVRALPTTWTSFDISSTKLYSVTSNTKVVLNALDKDVTIYWVVQSEKEDEVLENLLGKFESLSEHIEVVKKNPDVFPTFTSQYTDESVPNNSLIVECGDRNRYISFYDIYVTDSNMTTYSYEQSFDGEGAITSAIDYVVNEDQPKLYLLEGHGEADLPREFAEQLEKENVELNRFSLLNTDGVPEEADCVMIYAPSTDISEEETKRLTEYAENGGKLLVMAGPTEEGKLENLYALLEEKYYTIVPIAQGMNVPEAPAAADGTDETEEKTVTELLITSDTSFNKSAGFGLTSYEKEEGDLDGPFTVALSVACDNDGQIVWISSSNFLYEIYNAYSSGANLDFVMNALSDMIGENEAVAIRSKSLNYSYLTISDSVASILKTVMIGVVPLSYLLIGIIVVLKRRKRNEAI